MGGTIWILIPLAAILLGFFTEWLKFKSKQEKLGTSADELEGTVRELSAALERSEAQRKKLTHRLENLETIVTSEAWDALHEDALHEDALHEAERLPPLPSSLLDDEERKAPRERAERMARRLST